MSTLDYKNAVPLSSAPNINGLEPVEQRQIFINDISGDTTTSDLRNLFASAGKVTNVEIDTNELNRHFAFVTFESSGGVEQAIQNFTTTNLNNTTLVCRRRTELEQMRQKRMNEARCKLFVGNIPQTLTPEELRAEIQRVSQRPIIDFRHKKGYCFVGFGSPQDAEVAKRNLIGASCGGKSLNAEFKKEDPIRNEPGFIAVLEQAQRTLYVRDIPTSTSPERFRGIFEQYGKVRKFTLPTESRSNKLVGYAFIEYFWKEDCNKALAQTQSLMLDGVQIEIRISDPPKQDKGRFGRFDRGRGMSGSRGSYGSGGGGGGGRFGRDNYRRDSGRSYGGRDYRDRGRGMDRRGGGFRRSRSRSRSRSRDRGRYSNGHRGYSSPYGARAPAYGQPPPNPYAAAPPTSYMPPPGGYHAQASAYNPYAPPAPVAAAAAPTTASANPYGYNYGSYGSAYPYGTAQAQNGQAPAAAPAPAQQPPAAAQSAVSTATPHQSRPQTQQPPPPPYGAATAQQYAAYPPPYQQHQQPPPQQQQAPVAKAEQQPRAQQAQAQPTQAATPATGYPYYQGAQSTAYPANYYQQQPAAAAQAPQASQQQQPYQGYQYPSAR